MGFALIVALGALSILLGLPLRWTLRPFALVLWPIGFVFRAATARRSRPLGVKSGAV